MADEQEPEIVDPREEWRTTTDYKSLDPEIYTGDERDPRWKYMPEQYSDPAKYRLLRSGAIMMREGSRIIAKLPDMRPPAPPITHANSGDYHARRAELRRKGAAAWRRGMAKGTDSQTVLQAVEKIAQNMAGMSLDTDAKQAVPAARLTLEMGEFMAPRWAKEEQAEQGQTALSMTQAGLDRLLDILDRIDTIEARRRGQDSAG